MREAAIREGNRIAGPVRDDHACLAGPLDQQRPGKGHDPGVRNELLGAPGGSAFGLGQRRREGKAIGQPGREDRIDPRTHRLPVRDHRVPGVETESPFGKARRIGAALHRRDHPQPEHSLLSQDRIDAVPSDAVRVVRPVEASRAVEAGGLLDQRALLQRQALQCDLRIRSEKTRHPGTSQRCRDDYAIPAAAFNPL
ncbi:MAG: hypothetical protein ABIF45_10415 [Pseudomonadota bacterium]